MDGNGKTRVMIAAAAVAAIAAAGTYVARHHAPQQTASQNAPPSSKAPPEAKAEPKPEIRPETLDVGTLKSAAWLACSNTVTSSCVLDLMGMIVAGMPHDGNRGAAYAALALARIRTGNRDAAAVSLAAATSDAVETQDSALRAAMLIDIARAQAAAKLQQAEGTARWAIASAQAITDEARKAELLPRTAVALALAGFAGEASAIVSKLPDQDSKSNSKGLCEIAGLVAKANPADALNIVDKVSSHYPQYLAQAYVQIADGYEAKGAKTKAEALLQKTAVTFGKSDQITDLAALAAIYQRQGKKKEAKETYAKALVLPAARDTSSDEVRLIVELIRPAMRLGLQYESAATLQRLKHAADGMTDTDARNLALYEIASGLAWSGQFSDAKQLAQQLPTAPVGAIQVLRAAALRDISTAQAASGDKTGALGTIADIPSSLERVHALSALAELAADKAATDTPVIDDDL